MDASERGEPPVASPAPLTVHIAAGIHVADPSPRLEEIESTLEEIDVIFVESPGADSPGARSIALNAVATPLLVGTIYLWVATLGAWGTLTGRTDDELTARLGASHDATIVPTDRNVHRLIAADRGLWAAGHAIVAVVAVLAIPGASQAVPGLGLPALVAALALVAGVGLLGLFLAGTHRSRNLQMARDVERWALEHDADTACLVTGSQHEAEIRAALEESPFVRLTG